METIDVISREKMIFKDSAGPKETDQRKPEGFVEIYETNEETGEKKLVNKSNLVVYNGRELIAQRMVNVDNVSATTDKDEYICWFGIGSGGVYSTDPFNPISPNSLDDTLGSELAVSTTDTNCADYRDGSYYKKPFDADPVFEQDILNANRYLITKVLVTLSTTELNGTEISEAGLFTAESNTGGTGNAGPFNLYARVTFPTILKNSNRALNFVWYLYF